MKIAVRFFLLFIFFITIWVALSQINWVSILQVKEMTESTEEKLGKIIKNSIERSEEIIRDKEIKNVIDSIVQRISEKNNIDTGSLNILIVNNPQVNAFALPNKHIVIYTGLIKACDNAEALSGVIAHEMAHVQLNHVMKKLVKEVGTSILFSVTSNGGGEVLGEISRILSSSAYDRTLEEAADKSAVDYLLNANIDPEPLANFFYKLSLDEQDYLNKIQWLSTHPNSSERVESIYDDIKDIDQTYQPVISEGSWGLLKKRANSEIKKLNL